MKHLIAWFCVTIKVLWSNKFNRDECNYSDFWVFSNGNKYFLNHIKVIFKKYFKTYKLEKYLDFF